MFEVRPVRPIDLSRWIEMRSGLWPEEPAEDLAAEAAAFLDDGAAHLVEVLVAEDQQGKLAGFAELNLRAYAEGCTTSPVAFLEGWYVAPEYRGTGVGRALMSAAEEWGRERGCREFASDTTVDNLVSLAAHQALGFEEVEVIRCFRKELGGSAGEPAKRREEQFTRDEMTDNETTILYRPVGTAELALIRQSGNRAFPPRLPEQPIFYPVLSEEYATQIARDWNTKYNVDKAGYVTRFFVRTDFLRRYDVQVAGASRHQEYWIPAEELEEFNAHIIGEIEVIAEFHGDAEA